MCWVLTIQELETYILAHRATRPTSIFSSARANRMPTPSISTVIGVRGPIAPPEYCNGLMIPIVAFEQIYSFSRNALIEAIPRPEGTAAEDFGPAARELFDPDHADDRQCRRTDEHRALNYLAVRYPAIYARAAESFAKDSRCQRVEVRASPFSGTRKIVDCIFSYTNRNTDYPEELHPAVTSRMSFRSW